MKGVTLMQQKVNTVLVQAGSAEKEFKDVMILKGAEGLYIETSEKIGTDNEGADLIQTVLTMYPWEKILSLAWNENTLIDAVKQGVILEALQDLDGFLDDYEDEEDEVPEATSEEDSTTDKKDDPKVNPYE